MLLETPGDVISRLADGKFDVKASFRYTIEGDNLTLTPLGYERFPN